MSARVQVLAAALLFSTAGVVIKASSLTHWQIAGFRSAVGAVVLILAFPKLRRLSVPILAVACAMAVTFISFIVANKLTTAAHAVFFQAAAPLYLVLLGPWLLHEHLHRRDLPFMAAVLLGVGLLVTGTTQASTTAPNPALGNAVAMLSGVTWALSLAGLRWLDQREPAGRPGVSATVCANVLVAVVCLPLAWPDASIAGVDWAIVLYLGIFQLGLAYVLLVHGLRRLTAIETSLLLLMESALNPLWTWAGHGESPGPLALLGGGIILAATAVRSARRTAPVENGPPARVAT